MTIKTFTAATLSTIIAFSSVASFADDSTNLTRKEKIAVGKGAALFTTGAIAGAIAGGPIGAIIGAIGGAYIGEDLKRGARTEEQLSDTTAEVVNYQKRLDASEVEIAQLRQARLEKLEFQVLFTTGEDKLSQQDIQRINSLSIYLKKNPNLKIRLDGHADPRGTDEYNDLLSKERALAVINALEARGIQQDRITYSAHGSKLSTAYQGDLEAYAMERKVKIEVYAEETAVASN